MKDTRRAYILIPGDLLREIDAFVGPRGRSAFFVETARQEVRRRKLLLFLESAEPAWRDEDHPELAEGAAAWVRGMRRAASNRQGREQKRLAESELSRGERDPSTSQTDS